MPHPLPHLSDPDQTARNTALADRAEALEVIAFVDPAVLASVLGRSQPTAPLLVAARVGVEVADLRHAHWIALRDASKAMSVAYAEAGLARQPSLTELMRRRYPPNGDIDDGSTHPRPDRRMTAQQHFRWSPPTPESGATPVVVGKSTRTTARPSGRGPEATRQPPPLSPTPPSARLAVQVTDGRELAVLIDGPWRGRWYWRADLDAMQAAAHRYPHGHPAAELRTYQPTGPVRDPSARTPTPKAAHGDTTRDPHHRQPSGGTREHPRPPRTRRSASRCRNRTKTDTTPLAPPGGTDPGPDGAVLLDDLEAALRRYVSLPSEAAGVAVTLWIAATHAQPRGRTHRGW
ncbi:hypothetical protein [Pseudonocardia sp. Ae717_Ps2]|uniref:hypothetical protein n=1 Tax=Pseudonocardia sp. Ae717_Ps2 TaxID=1885573 RepID=UPI00094AB7CA|nr:hypothetical protein [Pseudonocardia sp. Ae717_Ps2]